MQRLERNRETLDRCHSLLAPMGWGFGAVLVECDNASGAPCRADAICRASCIAARVAASGALMANGIA